MNIGNFERLTISKDKAYLSLPDGSNLAWTTTFADIPAGKCGILVGSSGLIEIAANRMNAAELLKLKTGDHITLFF